MPILPNGVYSAIKAPGDAVFTTVTNHGNFSFKLSDLKAAGRLLFLDGDVAAAYTPPARPLTQGDASQHDFPAVTASGTDLLAAWVTYHNEANLVYLAHRKGSEWKVYPVTQAWGDYYGSAIAADGAGNVHVVWSEYKQDRWRLVSRTFHPALGTWDASMYVAAAGRRQMFHRMTSDANGTPWITWQEYGNGNFDIFVAERTKSGWSPPVKVSESRANNWDSAIAPAPDGSVWVAWDGYDGGNYDIFLRPIRGGKLQSIVRVTASETFDAHVSLAVDPQNRVWLSWDESGPNWGKDTGVLGSPGVALHASRGIRLVRYEHERFFEPVKPLSSALPGWLAAMNEYPHLTIGPNGLPYIFFRHFLSRIPMAENVRELQIGSKATSLQPWYDTVRQMWDVFVIGFDGAQWLPVRELPSSTGRCRMQTASTLSGNTLFYFWPKDGRTYADPYVKSAQLQYGEFAMSDKPSASDGMLPFASKRTGVSDAAPTEREDLSRVRQARWGTPPLRLFRGDLHRHTDISADGERDGDILDTYRYAMDAASLDFLAITDHSGHERLNYYHYDWWRNRQIATLFNNPGHFVTFFGYERTVTFPGGHRNIISTRRDSQPFRISDEEFTGIESYGQRLFPYLRAQGDIAIPHTTAGGGGTDWRANDPQAEPLVEIFQGLRGAYEEAKGPGKAQATNAAAGFVWNAWSSNHRLGVIAASDHNSTHESYACVWAPEFTAASIHAALKQRRTYAATDNILMKFEASDHKMGEEFAAAAPPEFRVEIQGTAPLARVEFIRNNRIVLTRKPGTLVDKFSYRDSVPMTGVSFYYFRLVQANKLIAWASPIWVRP